MVCGYSQVILWGMDSQQPSEASVMGTISANNYERGLASTRIYSKRLTISMILMRDSTPPYLCYPRIEI